MYRGRRFNRHFRRFIARLVRRPMERQTAPWMGGAHYREWWDYGGEG